MCKRVTCTLAEFWIRLCILQVFAIHCAFATTVEFDRLCLVHSSPGPNCEFRLRV